MKKSSDYFRLMLISLIIVGILQFFDLPKQLDYGLGVIAILLGVVGYCRKFPKAEK